MDDQSGKKLEKLREDVEKKDRALQKKIADDVNQLEGTDQKMKQELTKVIGDDTTDEKNILDFDSKFLEKI